MIPLNIGFAGMTHLGLNSAVAAAVRGVTVRCYDGDAEHIAELNRGNPHIMEPDLERLMEDHRSQILFSDDTIDLTQCDLVYVAPDVPTNDSGESDLTQIKTLIAEVDLALPADIPMVVLSQVPPGFCRRFNLKEGRTLIYQVETLIFGQAINRALYPERFIIGMADPSQNLPEEMERYLNIYECPILKMRYESAELAKISINCCLVASISVANTLAELCEHVGADWSEIVPALKKDKRIGPHSYLSPGLGIAGGNLERDLNTVMRLADVHGTDAGVVRAWVANSAYRKDWVLRTLHERILPILREPKIGVWGLAYKQDTHSTKNSPSLALLEHLGSFDVQVYDPQVKGVDGFELKHTASALDACDGVDVLAIMTPWSEFREVEPGAILEKMRGKVIIDPYRVLAAQDPESVGLTYMTLGKTLESETC